MILFQKSCIEFCINAKPLERYMPSDKNSMSYKMWKVVMSSVFEYMIMTLIVLNTLVLMMKFNDMPATYENVLRYLNMAFTFLFTIEAIMKIIALGRVSHQSSNLISHFIIFRRNIFLKEHHYLSI